MKTTIPQTSLFLALVILTQSTSSLFASDIPLWPLLRIEKAEANAAQGSNIDVLWPIFELNTTQPKTAFALRPLVSYDANRESGTFLFPIGWFGNDHFNLAPLLWTDWGENPHFLLPPIYGQWRGRETGFVIGPGLYLRSSSPEREKIGSLLPPIFRVRSKETNDQRDWILSYYQRRGDIRKDTALFPFFWWRSGTNGESHWTNREVYPFYGLRKVSDTQGEKSQRLRVLWPMVEVADHRDGYERNLLGYTVQWGKSGDSDWRAVLPFYYRKHSNEKQSFALPFLGFFSSTNRAAGEHRWLAWPFAEHRDGPEKEAWSFMSGLVRYRESKSTLDRKIAPLWPLAEWETAGDTTRHRFWPLYRFTTHKGPGTEKKFFALAEMVGYQEGDRMEGGFWFLLRPITFQQSDSGEKHFRFLWKLVESHKTKESRTWAINPLFYSRTDHDEKRWDFLGGLFGMKRGLDQTSLRALWFLNIRL